MSINRVTIAGFTGKEAWSRTAPNGKTVKRLSVATTKRYNDAEGTWHEKAQWHTCVCYGPTADYAAAIPASTHLFIEGELIYREYDRTIETESGPVKVPWPVTEVLVESLPVLDGIGCDGVELPRRFTCDGENVAPALHGAGEPSGTRSFAQIVDDPDVPRGTWNPEGANRSVLEKAVKKHPIAETAYVGHYERP